MQDVKHWTKEVYSHTNLYINFKNPNEKTIKYIKWGVMFQNAVGDYMTNGGNNIFYCSETGPFECGKGHVSSDYCWMFYSYQVNAMDVKAVRLSSVSIEYMDGSTVFIDDLDVLDAFTI